VTLSTVKALIMAAVSALDDSCYGNHQQQMRSLSYSMSSSLRSTAAAGDSGQCTKFSFRGSSCISSVTCTVSFMKNASSVIASPVLGTAKLACAPHFSLCCEASCKGSQR
jgi:hypothetical protein